MKIADPILLNLFMRDNEKCNITHAPSTCLSGTQFSIQNVFESLIPKDQKNITTLEFLDKKTKCADMTNLLGMNLRSNRNEHSFSEFRILYCFINSGKFVLAITLARLGFFIVSSAGYVRNNIRHI